MNRYVLRVCVIMLLLCASSVLFAQQKKSKKKTEKADVEKLEEVKIDEAIESPPTQVNTLGFDTTSAPDDELTHAIINLMKVTGALNLGKQIGKNIVDMGKQNPNNPLPPEFYERLIKTFDSEETNRWMMNGIVRIYREKFTLDEIKTITAFYETPTGKKAISLSPGITQQSMKLGEKIGEHIGISLYLEMVKEGKIKQ